MNDKGASKQKADSDDKFAAAQRVRLQIDAVASEALSGTVFFEIGDQTGARLTKAAHWRGRQRRYQAEERYIDWMVPQTDLKFRMGLQAVALPNVAGGSAVMDGDVAAWWPTTSSTRTWGSPPSGCARSTITTRAGWMPMTIAGKQITWTTSTSSP